MKEEIELSLFSYQAHKFIKLGEIDPFLVNSKLPNLPKMKCGFQAGASSKSPVVIF